MAQYELNLRDYIRIFRKRKLVIIITFVAIVIGGIFYFYQQPIVYKASATIKIDERKTVAGLLTEWILYSPGDIMESEPKIIKGFATMQKVALKLGLINDNTLADDLNNIVGGLQDRIETERVVDTNMIRIITTAPIAKGAMVFANTVAEVYIQQSLEEKAKQYRQTRQFIEEQLASVEIRLKEEEERMKELSSGDTNVTISVPVQQKLMELEFQLAELMQKYTDKHPKVSQLRAQIKEMESQVKGYSSKELEYARLNREIEVNKKLYGMFKEKLEEARIAEAQKVSDISVVNPAILPDAPVSGNRNIMVVTIALLGMILGLAFAFIFETLDTSIGTIEDVENVVKLPVLGVIPSIEDENKQEHNFFTRLKNRFLAVNKTELEERFTRLFSHYQPKSPTAEAYRNVHTNLKLNASKKCIMVTSSGPREGKSSFVSNLGLVMAQSGLKTVLVSADLRRPVLAKTFGIQKEPGLNELLTGSASLEAVLKNITDIMMGEINFEDLRKTPGIENIWIIPSGHLPFNPAELLESKEIVSLIEKLKARFDVVIFDAPPVLPVTDASLLAPKVDSVVIIYEIGRTSREALIRTKVQLESVGAKISGVVLNHTSVQSEAIVNYPYYSQKYRYYNSDEPDEKNKPIKKEKQG